MKVFTKSELFDFINENTCCLKLIEINDIQEMGTVVIDLKFKWWYKFFFEADLLKTVEELKTKLNKLKTISITLKINIK